MRMRSWSVYILGCTMLCLTACADADWIDTTLPSLKFNALAPAPRTLEVCGAMEDSVFQLMSGEQLNLDLLFRDDIGLSQYKIDIHSNFDCHGHGGGSVPGVVLPNIDNQTEDWSILQIESISGLQQSIQLTLDVPDNVTAGNYHFGLRVVDEAGNDDPIGNIYSIKLRNARDTIAPEISIDNPATSSLSASRGSNLRFIGELTDNYSLSEGGNGLVYINLLEISTGNTFNTNAVFGLDDDVEKVYGFDFEMTIPTTIQPGAYRLILGAADGVRNLANSRVFDLEVTD